MTMVRHMSETGFVRSPHLALLHVADDGAALLQSMYAHVVDEGDWLTQKLAPRAR